MSEFDVKFSLIEEMLRHKTREEIALIIVSVVADDIGVVADELRSPDGLRDALDATIEMLEAVNQLKF